MIDIVLSTYNGAEWLDQQIESIVGQTFGDWHLIARDDGSTDATPDILRAWQERLGQKMTIMASRENLGAARSFERLLEAAEARYIMFADQDDVWLPNKIELTLSRMVDTERLHPGEPVLVFTSLRIVDSNLSDTGDTFFSRYGYDFPFSARFNNICVNCCVTGCTMMLNKRAKAVSLPFGAHAPMHDWWIGATVARTGVLSVIEQPTMLYRAHGDNLCGVRKVEPHHLGRMLLHPRANLSRFNALKPFLEEVGFGGMAKFYFYKTRHYLHRKLRKR